MDEDKSLKDFENKKIKYLIKSLKFLEACLTSAIGVLQIYFIANFGSNSDNDENYKIIRALS